jgi:RNA polymerase sigma factor (sigma-70 family)
VTGRTSGYVEAPAYNPPSSDPPWPVLRTTNPDPESSTQLLDRLRTGDDEALELLIGRYLVPLRRWAHGRLPAWARSMSDTQDLVQDAVVRVLRHLATFEPERKGALHAYLRTAVLHRIFDEVRHAHRVPPGVELDEDLTSRQPSPFELAVGQEDREIFEAALEELREEDRELIIARVEWGLSYEEVAAALGKPTANAARMGVRRAVLRLAEVMNGKRSVDTA